MSSNRLLFQLAPLEPRTEETECLSLLPTPRAMEVVESPEAKVNRLHDRTANSMPNLSSMAVYRQDLLPTPQANKVNDMNLNNPTFAERNKSNLEEEIAKIVVSQDLDDGTAFQLSPLFVEEMMGFPYGWTELPFLSQNGETKP
jgi:hypothetical protein